MIFVTKLLFLSFLFSCSLIKHDVKVIKYNDIQIEKEFKPAVKVFEHYCHRKLKTNIRFSIWMPGERTIGFCWPLIIPTIFIKKEWWDLQGELAQEELILHELGHCELLRMHNDKWIEGKEAFFSKPESLMHHVLYPLYYKENRDYYLKEYCN